MDEYLQETHRALIAPAVQAYEQALKSPPVQAAKQAWDNWAQQIDIMQQGWQPPEELRRQMETIEKLFDAPPIGNAIELFLAQLASLSFLDSEEFRRIIRDKETRDAFNFASLFPSPYTDENLRLQVVAAYKAGKTATHIQGLVMTHYDARNAARVSKIVTQLKKNPWFKGREDVLSQTLEAHRQKLDAISTYPLVSMIEGVLRRYLMAIEPQLKVAEKAEYKVLKVALWEMLCLAPYTVGLPEASGAIEYFGEHVAANFKWSNPPQEDVADEELHRHPLLHGHSLRGSRLNTLRCFLMLDFIAAMMASVP